MDLMKINFLEIQPGIESSRTPNDFKSNGSYVTVRDTLKDLNCTAVLGYPGTFNARISLDIFNLKDRARDVSPRTGRIPASLVGKGQKGKTNKKFASFVFSFLFLSFLFDLSSVLLTKSIFSFSYFSSFSLSLFFTSLIFSISISSSSISLETFLGRR